MISGVCLNGLSVSLLTVGTIARKCLWPIGKPARVSTAEELNKRSSGETARPRRAIHGPDNKPGFFNRNLVAGVQLPRHRERGDREGREGVPVRRKRFSCGAEEDIREPGWLRLLETEMIGFLLAGAADGGRDVACASVWQGEFAGIEQALRIEGLFEGLVDFEKLPDARAGGLPTGHAR